MVDNYQTGAAVPLIKTATIWLNGSYPAEEQEFYRQRIIDAVDRGIVVAVDGALSLFFELGQVPHLAIGDFDSVPPEILATFAGVRRIDYPRDKDQTDGELALQFLLGKGFTKIDVYGAVDTAFETDHMLANIFGLIQASEHARQTDQVVDLRLVDHQQFIYVLENEALELNGQPGEMFSVIPLSPEIELSLLGSKWELDQEKIRFGSSRPLRNEFVAPQVKIVLGGMAIVIHRYTRT